MNRSQADNWSTWRSLAFLAATFAVVLGTLLPFGAMAAARPGQPIVICSAEGLQTIHTGGVDGPAGKGMGAAKCAVCVMPLLAALPPPPAPEPEAVIHSAQAVVYAPFVVADLPPARAPPRPPSTAPPHA